MAKRLEKDLYEKLADKVSIPNLLSTLEQTSKEIVEKGEILSDVKNQFEAITLVRELILEEFEQQTQ